MRRWLNPQAHLRLLNQAILGLEIPQVNNIISEDFYNSTIRETDTNRHYDWCLEYSHLKDFLAPHLKPSDRILMVGCGNSSIEYPSHSFIL